MRIVRRLPLKINSEINYDLLAFFEIKTTRKVAVGERKGQTNKEWDRRLDRNATMREDERRKQDERRRAQSKMRAINSVSETSEFKMPLKFTQAHRYMNKTFIFVLTRVLYIGKYIYIFLVKIQIELRTRITYPECWCCQH